MDKGAVRTGNRRLMRELNTNLVVQAIRRHQPISQVDIARCTRLSAGTVTNIVKTLRSSDLVSEAGPADSRVGRPRTLLRLNRTSRYAVGVQLSAEETRLALVDLEAHVRARSDHPTDGRDDPARAMQVLAGHIRALLASAGVPESRVLGVGLGVDGVVDVDRGVLRYSAHFAWRDAPLRRLLEDQTGLSVTVDGTGPCMAFGEYAYGAGRDADSLLCIDIDAGIGAVAIVRGRIVRGASHMAGEIGHSPAVPDGARCRCGRCGCLETVASGTAIVARVRRRLSAGQASTLSGHDLSGPTREVIGTVFEAAGQGDPLAREVVDEATRYLGMAVAQLVSFADPETVILTGFVTHESGGRLRDAIDAYVSEHVLSGRTRSVPIRDGSLGEDAAVIGAGAVVTENAYRLHIEA